MLEFIVLGQIPGTSVFLSFSDMFIVFTGMVLVGTIMVNTGAHKTLNSYLEKYIAKSPLRLSPLPNSKDLHQMQLELEPTISLE